MKIQGQKVPKYRIYIDEAGDHTYRDLVYVSHRYLALLGCVFKREPDYKKAARDMKSLKNKYWPDQDPDSPIIFHREEMVNCREYFSIFKGLLTFHNTYGDVLAESRGGREDMQLKQVYREIYNNGTDYRNKVFFRKH